MTYVYIHKYKRFHTASEQHDPLDAYVCLPGTAAPLKNCFTQLRHIQILQTLNLACLSLASKATESPRRMREILPPAYQLLNAPKQSASTKQMPRLTIPSALYDNLRATLVQAELLLLRILGFEVKVSLPLDFLPRYLERAFQDPADAGEDYDSWSGEEREEYGVLNNLLETGIGRSCRTWAVKA